MTYLIGAAFLGGFGAVLRFVLDGVASGHRTPFPVGTLVVNLLGALVLGISLGAGVSGDALKLLAIGLLGSFTTFSTWVFETHRLAEDGLPGTAAANISFSLLLGLLAIWVGQMIGGAL
jgi:fluoride exporter